MSDDDIVDRLRKRALIGFGSTGEHRLTLEWEAADEIERLRAEVDDLRRAETEWQRIAAEEGWPDE